MDALTDLAIIWTGVLLAIYAARHTRLTPVLYYLAVGAIFVNIGILPEQPQEFIRGFAEIGIILIMFALGFEEHVDHFLKSIRKSWGSAFFGALAPFLTAFAVADYFWNDFRVALMCGLTMTATAVSLTMVVLRSEGLHTTKAASRIMTSAILDDMASLALLAALIPIVVGDDTPSVVHIGFTILKVAMFFLVVSVLGAWVFPHPQKGWLAKIPLIRDFGLRHLLGFEDGEYATLMVLLLALSIGLLAHAFGFHPAVGAYMAGLILREEYFSSREEYFSVTTPGSDAHQNTKRIIDNVAFSWIGPVFFVVLGTQLVFDWDMFVSVIPQTLALTSGILVSQIVSAGLAA